MPAKEKESGGEPKEEQTVEVDVTIRAEEDDFFPTFISDDENEAVGVEIIEDGPVRRPTLPTPPAGSGPGRGRCLSRAATSTSKGEAEAEVTMNPSR